MFIEPWIYKVLRSSGATCMLRPTNLPARCAPLERRTLVSGEVYKHLTPTEPRTSFDYPAEEAP